MGHSFTSRVDSVLWGRNRYTVIRVPEDLATDARQAGTRRVAGTVDGVRVNAAVNTAPVVDGPFLWAGAPLLRRIGVEPGEPVDCVLEPVDPDVVELPEDVALALVDGRAQHAWEALSAPARRRHLHAVETARKPATRARRITELVAVLRRGFERP